MSEALIAALTQTLVDDPRNVDVRCHLAALLYDAGRHHEALGHAHMAALFEESPGAAAFLVDEIEEALATGRVRPSMTSLLLADGAPDDEAVDDTSEGGTADDTPPEREKLSVGPSTPASDDLWDIVRPAVTLADVAGMQDVKQRLERSYLAPLRNPELRAAFGASMRSGLLLYGPPGCGKTYLARALAGELGIYFIAVGLADVLDMWVGSSERNLAKLFAAARELAPAVVFIDEVDALGHKRAGLTHSGTRNVVNQLLAELDGAEVDNDGVLFLAATNRPWDVDGALRRPGRFDRSMLVLPPDAEARRAILEANLVDRPVADGLSLDALVASTDGWSGADLVHVVETATEAALSASIDRGDVQPIDQATLQAAAAEIRPSTGEWFRSAKAHVTFGNTDGQYDELADYIRDRRL